MKYTVIKNYFDSPKNPIEITEGEILEFIKKTEDNSIWPNWVYCKGNGKTRMDSISNISF